jgi:hypothetical protein
VHSHPNLIFSAGTQVVTLVDIPGSAARVEEVYLDRLCGGRGLANVVVT